MRSILTVALVMLLRRPDEGFAIARVQSLFGVAHPTRVGDALAVLGRTVHASAAAVAAPSRVWH